MSYDLDNAVLIKKGKVKDIYRLSSGELLFHFTDRVSAFDVPLPSPIGDKGKVLCLFSEYWFNSLGIPHHMQARVGLDKMVVKRLEMVKLECVVRGYLYGSLYERCKAGEARVGIPLVLAAKLPEPLFDPTTKSEEKDEPITEEQTLKTRVCTKNEYHYLKNTSIKVYQKMTQAAEKTGFIIADLKLEFGRDENGSLLLADSIGPDEFRLWSKETYSPGKLQEAYDKQIVRDWLAENGYKNKLDEARKHGDTLPPPPPLPQSLVKQVQKRYVEAYERLTGKSFPA